MKPSKYENNTRNGAHRSSQIKKVPIFDDDTPASINNKSCLTDGGTCDTSIQQQIVQNSRSSDYINKMTMLSFYQLCNV